MNWKWENLALFLSFFAVLLFGFYVRLLGGRIDFSILSIYIGYGRLLKQSGLLFLL